jgi:enediyne biosynthesis protein E4
MAAGRFGMAARNLAKLLAWKPSSDEAAYMLGICEQARGRPQEAAEAWTRVTPGSGSRVRPSFIA